MAVFRMNDEDFAKLQTAIENFPGDAEAGINEILHNEGSQAIQEAVRRLMPMSGKSWKGKNPPAKTSKSLRDKKENLSVTVRTSKNYQYLYFPDDGINTRRHVGNQRFFLRGGEAAKNEIIERCITKLTTDFNKGV